MDNLGLAIGLKTADYPAFIVNEAFAVIAINERQGMVATPFVTIQNGRLETAKTCHQTTFQNTLAAALSRSSPAQSMALITAESGERAVLRAQAIHKLFGLDVISPHAAVWVKPLDRAETPDPQVFARVFGLTPAESLLAAALCAGESLAEAAEKLHISQHTARDRLKAIFAKTGTNRQTDLALLLQRLS